MPLNPSSNTLRRLKGYQIEAMDDVCHIYQVSRASGTYGTQITETRSFRASGVACGIDYAEGSVPKTGQVEFVEYDVLLRLPTSQVISNGDEVDLYEKGDIRVSGTFVLASPPSLSSSAQYTKLKRQVS